MRSVILLAVNYLEPHEIEWARNRTSFLVILQSKSSFEHVMKPSNGETYYII